MDSRVIHSDETESVSSREILERHLVKRKRFATYGILSLLVLSLILILTSLALPEILLRRYVNELRRSGASVRTVEEPLVWLEDLTGFTFSVHQRVVGIAFGQFRATDHTLDSISNWSTLEFVELSYAEISEQSLSHFLSRCTNLNVLQIVSCPKISPGFIQQLRLKYPALNIDYRGVAYLGIAGRTHPKGCEIYYVDPGMPAHRAGVRVGDVLIFFDKQSIADFENLVSLIGEHQPEDVVTLTVLRQDKELSIDCKLTGWRSKLP